ncbi:GNAT family N-acetyltransferase [Halorussus halophilus]|uniref:GNAT family N-acetyltransferase n=1 Tax=Halorussus halophilus TaxID=2650975 RepID=UPI0013014536|nr:GNAT family N-acetyltransferase [Halorussus halophilus]
MRIEKLTLAEWEQALPDEGFGVFHTPEALGVLDEHTDGELHLFGGFKGQQPVALLPLVVRDRPFVRMALSPPLGYGIRRLGPILMPTSPKRRKREQVNSEFAESVLRAVDADDARTLFRLSCSTEYADPRPYGWAGLDLETRFTYSVPLAERSPEQVKQSFSKSLRRDIRDAEDLDVSVEVRGLDGARDIYRTTKERFEEQGIGFPMSAAFMRDLVDALDDRARMYVAESSDGEFLGGIAALFSNDAAYFWKGGTKGIYDGVSLNGLLHWRIIEDVLTDPELDDISRYDLYTANDERLARYKAKFGGELRPYHVVESAGTPMTAAKKGYRMLAFGENLLG